jgi:hypothetical protein
MRTGQCLVRAFALAYRSLKGTRMKRELPLIVVAAPLGAIATYLIVGLDTNFLDVVRRGIFEGPKPSATITTLVIIVLGCWIMLSCAAMFPLLWLTERGARREGKVIETGGKYLDEYNQKQLGLTPTPLMWSNAYRWLTKGFLP